MEKLPLGSILEADQPLQDFIAGKQAKRYFWKKIDSTFIQVVTNYDVSILHHMQQI